MTNREIANVLGCTPTTVYRYLGPDGTRGKHSRGGAKVKKKGLDPDEYAACKAHIEAKKAEAWTGVVVKSQRLVTTDMTTTMRGKVATYMVSGVNKQVTIVDGDSVLKVKYADLGEFIEDLKAIKEAYIHE